MALTRRQREVLDVIRELIERNGYSPSLEEIGTELGLSSVATVHKHVSHLVQKGYVRRTWNQNRSIELVEAGERRGAVLIPLEGRLPSAGAGSEGQATDTVAVPVEMLQDPAVGFALQVAGNTLAEELLQDADFLILERRDPRDGESVVVLVDERDNVLGRYRLAESRVVVEPRGSHSSPVLADPERIHVRGVVVGMIRKY
jgi:repressor LexA